MILVEEYDNDYVKEDLVIDLKPIDVYTIYKGSYKKIKFEIKVGKFQYPKINWLENYKVLNKDICELEKSIIVDFIEQV